MIESEILPDSRSPEILSIFDIILIIITDIIGPVDAMATNPKLSLSDALQSFFNCETPIASARIKGTVNAPVVAPEASKDIAKNSREVIQASIKMIPYIIVNSLYNGMLYTILPRPTASMIAIPIDTI